MPAASTPGGTLVAGLKLALKAANAYVPRNEGDRSESEFITNLLSDTLRHAEQLDELAEVYARQERVRLAQLELRHAEAGVGPSAALQP